MSATKKILSCSHRQPDIPDRLYEPLRKSELIALQKHVVSGIRSVFTEEQISNLAEVIIDTQQELK